MSHTKEIVDILRKFQKGYDEKRPENVYGLMMDIFSGRQDLLTLGTGSTELCLGRDEVMKLIHDDWDGGWGDFAMDIENAKIEVDGNTAWFYVDSTVKYVFRDADEKDFARYVDWIKEIAEKQNASPKQRLSFLNWALGMHYHQRKAGQREYLWPSDLSGMMLKEGGTWKIATLHFATAKSNYPDERFEDIVEDYLAYHDHTRKKITAHEGNKVDSEIVKLLNQLEEWRFDPGQIIQFGAGRFAWIMAIGATKQNISEDEVFDESLREIRNLFASDLSAEDKIFQAKRSIAYALKETAWGAEFTWPIRLTAVVEKTKDGYKFRHKHLSYPFEWIFEGKL